MVELIEEFIDTNVQYFKYKYESLFLRDITEDKYFKFYIYLIFINITRTILEYETQETTQKKIASIFNHSYWMDHRYFVFIIDKQLKEKIREILLKQTDKIDLYKKFIEVF